MLLDVLVQQLDGRVERVINAALVSLRDEGSHNFGEKDEIVPNITAGGIVSSSVAEDTPEDFFPSRAGGWLRGFKIFIKTQGK